jgi:hypothetical protein
MVNSREARLHSCPICSNGTLFPPLLKTRGNLFVTGCIFAVFAVLFLCATNARKLVSINFAEKTKIGTLTHIEDKVGGDERM